MLVKYGANLEPFTGEGVVAKYGTPAHFALQEDKNIMDTGLFIVVNETKFVCGVYDNKESAIKAAMGFVKEYKTGKFYVAEVMGCAQPIIETEWVEK